MIIRQSEFFVIIIFVSIKSTLSDIFLNSTEIENPGQKVDFMSSFPPNSSNSNEPRSRKKRFVWITDDGALAFPPGTLLVVSPTFSMPLLRNIPNFMSNLGINTAFTLNFDDLGITSDQNPFGVMGPGVLRSMARKTGNILANYVKSFLNLKKRRKRDLENLEENEVVQLPEKHKKAFHGGERAILYVAVENLLESFGLSGRECLLRVICEVQARPMNRYGLVGEVLKLFLTASLSPFANLMDDYVLAEQKGKVSGNCSAYKNSCGKSLFRTKKHKVAIDAD